MALGLGHLRVQGWQFLVYCLTSSLSELRACTAFVGIRMLRIAPDGFRKARSKTTGAMCPDLYGTHNSGRPRVRIVPTP